jgi:hypothetical protein
MVDLPTPQAIAKLVSTATQMLFATSVEFYGPCLDGVPDAGGGMAVVIPLIGSPMYVVTAKANGDSGLALAMVMFECELDAVDDGMVEDSLREIINIFAGQIKSLLAPTHQLGLPSRLTDDQTLIGWEQFSGARIFLRHAHAEIDIGIAVFDAPHLD